MAPPITSSTVKVPTKDFQLQPEDIAFGKVLTNAAGQKAYTMKDGQAGNVGDFWDFVATHYALDGATLDTAKERDDCLGANPELRTALEQWQRPKIAGEGARVVVFPAKTNPFTASVEKVDGAQKKDAAPGVTLSAPKASGKPEPPANPVLDRVKTLIDAQPEGEGVTQARGAIKQYESRMNVLNEALAKAEPPADAPIRAQIDALAASLGHLKNALAFDQDSIGKQAHALSSLNSFLDSAEIGPILRGIQNGDIDPELIGKALDGSITTREGVMLLKQVRDASTSGKLEINFQSPAVKQLLAPLQLPIDTENIQALHFGPGDELRLQMGNGQIERFTLNELADNPVLSAKPFGEALMGASKGASAKVQKEQVASSLAELGYGDLDVEAARAKFKADRPQLEGVEGEALDRAILASPFASRGRAALAAHDPKKAEADLARAYELYPSPGTALGYARALKELGRPEEAKVVYERCLQLAAERNRPEYKKLVEVAQIELSSMTPPRNDEVQVSLASLGYGNLDYEAARKKFIADRPPLAGLAGEKLDRAIIATTLFNKGRDQFENEKDFGKSEASFRRAYELLPSPGSAIYLARSLRREGRFAEAKLYYERSIVLAKERGAKGDDLTIESAKGEIKLCDDKDAKS